MIPTGQAMWSDIFRRGVSRQQQIARARIHTSCVSSTGQTGFISVQAPGRKCDTLERWPRECCRFRRKPIIRGSALVTAKGSRRAERAGFLVVNYALNLTIFVSAGVSCAGFFDGSTLRANARWPSRCKCRRKRRSSCRVQTALRAILMPFCVASGLDIGICMTSSRHCSSFRKSNSVSRSQGFGSLSGSGASSGSGSGCARFESLTFVFHQAISSGVRLSCDGLRSGRPRRRVESG